MSDLDKLKDMIDEANYPYYDDAYLLARLEEIGIDYGASMESIAKELCINKAGIEEIKLGDIIIPSPKRHFLTLASKYRVNRTGVVVRADDR